MTKVTDQMGREVEVVSTTRVISLVPSITELLIDLGVNVVGRTKFCVHPEAAVKLIPVIGGTKKFRLDEVERLSPDLIVGNKEENYKEGIEYLAQRYPVWISDIRNVEDALQLVIMLGEVTNKDLQAVEIHSKLSATYAQTLGSAKGKVLYFIWRNPWMTAGSGTYIDTMLRWCGYENMVEQERYPTIDIESWTEKHGLPDEILLSSEPFPFKDMHIEELKAFFPGTKIRLVNGEYYSWYGTRLLKLDDDLPT
jgi:ABC-type Fe3+-hydroxamate transport system substrate-binding protein